MKEHIVDASKEVIVIYHKNCHDGFASAWSAWKKFGDRAEYIEASYGDAIPKGVEGKEVFVLDFSYDKERLDALASQAKRLVVIDHHKGAIGHVTSQKEHVFELEHSGAYLSWKYFHPELPVPLFIEYISEQDIYSFTLPDHETFGVYIFSRERDFSVFDSLSEEFETEEGRKDAMEKGEMLLRYRSILLKPSLSGVHFIELSGVILPAVNTTLPLDEKSYLLHLVYQKYPPVSLSYRYDDGQWKCSLRSDGSFDCTVLAGKFGGSGHVGSSGFAIPFEEGVFPFKVVDVPEEWRTLFEEGV